MSFPGVDINKAKDPHSKFPSRSRVPPRQVAAINKHSRTIGSPHEHGPRNERWRRQTYPIRTYKQAPTGIHMADGSLAAQTPSLPPGAVGGRFSSTTGFRAVSHSSMRNMYSKRGTRLQPIFSQRWVAVPPERNNIAGFDGLPSRSGVPMTVLDKTIVKDRFLGETQETDPERPEVGQSGSYMLMGSRVTPSVRKHMDQEELLQFSQLGLVPAPELYFGRGFSSHKSVRLRALNHKRASSTSPLETSPVGDGMVNTVPIESIKDGNRSGNEETEVEEAMEAESNENEANVVGNDPDCAPCEEDPKADQSPPAISGWAGTVLDGDAVGDSGTTNTLIKHADSQPSELDLYTYQIRELYAGASDETVARLSDAFMLLDAEGTGNIQRKDINNAISQDFGQEKLDLVSKVFAEKESQMVSLREYIAITYIAECLAAQNIWEAFSSVPEKITAETFQQYFKIFFDCDVDKAGKIEALSLRNALSNSKISVEDVNWKNYNDSVADENGYINFMGFILHFPQVLLVIIE